MRTYSRFSACIPFVLSEEGGYVNDPDDAGGETKFGISKRAYPDLDIAHLTREQAVDIYRRDYWDMFHCDEWPAGLDFALFDAAVQHHPKSAIMLLQRAIGVPADGVVGPVTLATAPTVTLSTALIRYFVYRAGLYADLITADSRNAKFRDGWFGRLFRLQREIQRTISLAA